MDEKSSFIVREINNSDIKHLADYWFNSTPEHLKAMGADKNKLPEKSIFIQMMKEQISSSIKDKKSYALIWEIDKMQIGHSNINNIIFGKEATMHLHLWSSLNRKKGIGTKLVKKSLPYYFKNLELKKIICEPYSLNQAPNKTLEKLGFDFVKRYTTIPGTLNFEQEVNRWELTLENYKNKTQYNKQI